MIAFDEAIALIRSVATPLGDEIAPIATAAGRVLAAPVVARIDSPRADVSTMDGYAVREADLGAPPVSLRVIGEAFAGAAWDGTVTEGTCARIFTGAPVPDGADRVVIQENVRRDGDIAIIDADTGSSRYIRTRGSDFVTGDVLLPAGCELDPRALVAAAAADIGSVTVYRQPRLFVLSTGDELAEPGTARERPNAVPDSLSLGVAALAEQWGASCCGQARAPDDLAQLLDAAVAAVNACDILVVSGGASVGERDFAQAMFEPLGLELVFSKIAIKPGKPAWLGRAGNALILGLPGNPTSAMVTARLLLAPLLAGLRGQPIDVALQWRSAPLAALLAAGDTRETFHRAHWNNSTLDLLSDQDSGAQGTLAQADLLVRQPANGPPLPAGAMIDVLDF